MTIRKFGHLPDKHRELIEYVQHLCNKGVVTPEDIQELRVKGVAFEREYEGIYYKKGEKPNVD